MRLSDILKKASQKQEGVAADPEQTAPKVSSILRSIPKEQSSPLPIAEEKTSVNPEDAYTKAVMEIKNIISCVEKGTACSSPVESVPLMISLLDSGNEDILLLSDRATPDIYLYGYCVNLCILSLFLGKGFNYSADKFLSLGMAALLCDTGMQKAYSQAKPEQPQDRSLIERSRNMVNSLPGLSGASRSVITGVISAKHGLAQADGTDPSSGNPDVGDFLKIISVADAYETMTHPRTGKDRVLPHEALKNLIGSAGQEFDASIVKLFLERISLYPPGSYVRLNSDEIGKIIGINKGMPTRPRVKILIDAAKQRVPEKRILDLSSNPMLFIKEAVDETKLNLPDKKLAIELKAARWWVKGL